MILKRIWFLLETVLILSIAVACGNSEESSNTSSNDDEGVTNESAETIKIGVLASLTGALESYGKQTRQGFDLGLEYATDGTMEVAGNKIEVIYEDTETKPE